MSAVRESLIIDEDIREYFQDLFENVANELKVDVMTDKCDDVNGCDNCDICVIGLLIEIGECIMDED